MSHCTPNLFRLLDWPDRSPRSSVVVLPLFPGTGPTDPVIVFRMPGTTDMTELSEAALSRLICHWLLTQLPDQEIEGVVTLLAAKWRFSPAQAALSSTTPATHTGGRYGVAAIIPRSQDPDDDLVVYEEKADSRTIDWVLSLRKRK